MSYEHTISEIVKVVEGAGAGIMVLGGLGSFAVFVPRARAYEPQRCLCFGGGALNVMVLVVAGVLAPLGVRVSLTESLW